MLKESVDLSEDLSSSSSAMHRELTWKNAFWIVSGISTSILLSIGSMVATIGTPSWVIWMGACLLTLAHLFIYAELAGMFPNHSGGVSIAGAIAWRRYGKVFAPINIWCNWLGWSATPAVVASISGGYLVSAFFPDTPFAKFSWTFLDLSSILPGIAFRVDATILSGIAILLIAFCLQYNGVLQMARVQFLIAILSVIPILLLVAIPLLTGKIDWSHFTPFLLEGTTSWFSLDALRLVAGGLFIALWTTFATEAATSYVSEFKDPERDTPRAIAASGLLALLAFTLLPFTFLGVLGVGVLKDPAMADPQAALVRMASLTLGAGLGSWITVMLVMAMTLLIITCMANSSRTLYQASLEGWLPKYLGQLNRHGIPAKATWTDLVFNLFLLCLGNPIFVLAASNVVYLFGVVMNLIAAWMHRRDRPNHARPYRVPDWLIAIGVPLLAGIDLLLIVFGANVFAPNALLYGLIAIAVVIPIFCYRYYLVDRHRQF